MPIDFSEWRAERGPLVRIVRWMLAIGLLILLFWLLGAVVLLIFASALLATLLTVASAWVHKHLPIGYGWSLALVVVTIIVVIVGISLALAPAVSTQLNQIAKGLPQALNSILGGIEKSPIGQILMSGVTGGGGAGGFTGPLISTVGSLFVTIGYIIFVLFMGLYLAAQPKLYERGLVRLVPPDRRDRAREIIETVGRTLKYFLFGRLFSMCVIAACSMVGLWILGVPAPIALGLIAGVLSFVPYVGSAASGVAPFLLGYMQNPMTGVYVIILYIGIHLLDGYILVPLVQREMVHLPPGVTLTAQLVLGVLWGLLGIAVATPLAAVTIVLVDMAYIQDMLHERVTPPGQDD